MTSSGGSRMGYQNYLTIETGLEKSLHTFDEAIGHRHHNIYLFDYLYTPSNIQDIEHQKIYYLQKMMTLVVHILYNIYMQKKSQLIQYLTSPSYSLSQLLDSSPPFEPRRFHFWSIEIYNFFLF